MADQAPVVVPVRSALLSRINQIALFVFALAVPIGALANVLPPPWQGRALAAASFLGSVGIIYYRTFQTASVTPSSVASTTTVTPTLNQVLSATGTTLRAAGVDEPAITDALNAASAAATKSPL